jgi:hypothetical protein
MDKTYQANRYSYSSAYPSKMTLDRFWIISSIHKHLFYRDLNPASVDKDCFTAAGYKMMIINV